MTKAELLKALEPFKDDIVLWMEADAGVALVGSISYEPDGIERGDNVAALIICPLPDVRGLIIESPKS
jgi:hypothetical protein